MGEKSNMLKLIKLTKVTLLQISFIGFLIASLNVFILRINPIFEAIGIFLFVFPAMVISKKYSELFIISLLVLLFASFVDVYPLANFTNLIDLRTSLKANFIYATIPAWAGILLAVLLDKRYGR